MIILYIILGLLALTIASVIQYQYQVRRYERSLYGQGGAPSRATDDVLSLDDEEHQAKDYGQAPSKALMAACLGLTVIAVFYWVFFDERSAGGPKGDITYDELAGKYIGETLVSQMQGKQGIKVMVVLPPARYDEYSRKKDGDKFPALDLLKEAITTGNRMTIVAVESSVLIDSVAVLSRDDVDLTTDRLRDLMKAHPEVQVVIALVGYAPDLTKRADRNFVLACYSQRANLFHYLAVAKANAADLAVVSRGLYTKNSLIPAKAKPEDLIKRHFLAITPKNYGNFGTYQQYIGTFPVESNDFCK